MQKYEIITTFADVKVKIAMKHIRLILLVATLSAAVSVPASGWGQKGHDVTCAIARKHLTKKTQKKIEWILDGKSIVYWANWMDSASNTPQYRYTKTWHYKNIDGGMTYDNAVKNENGDVETAINAQIAVLKEGGLNKEAQALALKMLVHFIGDIHCPMHLGHLSDRGGNNWQIQYFRYGNNLHRVWDTEIIESAHKWTYTEWAEEIDLKDKALIADISKGSVSDWGRETFSIATDIYNTTPVGSKLSYNYVDKWTPVVEMQLLKGGIRLAAVLNDIFDHGKNF